MSKRMTIAGLMLVSALSQIASVDSQGRLGERVQPFTRPTESRLKASPGSNRSALGACSATQDEMCQKFSALAAHFVNGNKIPARDRELLTLRTAWLSRGEYIWAAHHTSYAMKAGLTPEEVARVTKGPDAKGWSRFDATLLRAVDELHASRFVSDETWKSLGEKYDDRLRLEVVLTVANYTMLAMYFNSTGAQLPAGRSGFPTD